MPEVIFNGPEGRLEGRYSHSQDKDAPLALILHPSPELGGTMNNKITYMMHQIFVQRGFKTLRFNFRGVGRSQGVYDHGEGELSDAASALDWMQEINPNAPYVWVGGFAFGAWISMQLLMRRPEIQGFVSVAPPTNTQDFTFLAPCPTSGLVMHGSRDDVVTAESITDFAEKIQLQKGIEIDCRQIDGANHFFHGYEDQLVANINDHLDRAGAGRSMNTQSKLLAAAE
ncbi:MAG: alpha/beta hydrolase [Alphaproteobacteria bacterium]|nr:alpha/beta hydrolase [Alphaproteobacteria bacterium]HCQ70786.1 alpha/beta hydrolase [Rhodospirillaceae bacterium]|tara:strand:+ start:7504 stop:8187 length:684 start_codon:yes stop_codon:yes gene_type:complete